MFRSVISAAGACVRRDHVPEQRIAQKGNAVESSPTAAVSILADQVACTLRPQNTWLMRKPSITQRQAIRQNCVRQTFCLRPEATCIYLPATIRNQRRRRSAFHPTVETSH